MRTKTSIRHRSSVCSPLIYREPRDSASISYPRGLKSSTPAAFVIEDRSLWDKAFRLAYFIWPNRSFALQITIKALAGVDQEFSNQKRRNDYEPLKRRTKVSKSRPQLLQHLILRESASPELFLPSSQTVEMARHMSADDLLVRYITYLVRIAWRRSSFHVSVGIGRLLHDYSTAETRSITDLMTQSPERLRDDAGYRLAKSVLMREMKQHFGPLLEIRRVTRGEQRFHSRCPTERERSLVKTYLEMLTPWETNCGVPEIFDPVFDPLPDLTFKGRDPDDEHPVDMRRIHTILHPICYARTAQALDLDEPKYRLVLPCFTRDAPGDQRTVQESSSTRRSPRSLSAEEHSMIGVAVTCLGERRRK